MTTRNLSMHSSAGGARAAATLLEALQAATAVIVVVAITFTLPTWLTWRIGQIQYKIAPPRTNPVQK